MGRLLSLVLGLAVVSLGVYWALTHLAGAAAPDPEGRSQPKVMLDQTRAKAKAIEDDAQRRADEALRRSDEAR